MCPSWLATRHRELLVAQATELSGISVMTVECVADVIMGADEAVKHDLANTVDISQSVDSIKVMTHLFHTNYCLPYEI